MSVRAPAARLIRPRARQSKELRNFEADDFGAEPTPELRDQEERLRAQIDAKP